LATAALGFFWSEASDFRLALYLPAGAFATTSNFVGRFKGSGPAAFTPVEDEDLDAAFLVRPLTFDFL
jgi:hypothetical protein